jgi:hypothetical protein
MEEWREILFNRHNSTRLPIPIIFLRDLRADLKSFKAKRDVVDGQQRIRTILSFIDRDLLKDFDDERDNFAISKTHNPDLGGLRFADLSRTDKQAILDYQFSVHSFPADTDDREILTDFCPNEFYRSKIERARIEKCGVFWSIQNHGLRVGNGTA